MQITLHRKVLSCQEHRLGGTALGKDVWVSGLRSGVLRRTPTRSLQRRLRHRHFDVTACQKLARLSGALLR
jgi:hypothetical protein